MKKFFGTILFIIPSIHGFTQGYYSEFQELCQMNDTIKQLELLLKWESEFPKDPELFTSYFNYYFLKSKKEIVVLTTEEPEGESLVVTDSTDQRAGYLASQTYYSIAEFRKGLDKIDEGIELYPDRLDMRFGKIYTLGQIEDWEEFTNEIIKAIQHSSVKDNKWTWTLNEELENDKEFFLTALQDYQVQLYSTGNDSLLINMRSIANEILKYYPDHIESLSNLSITYLLTGNYDNALESLLKAEKLNPEDYVVLSNIAQGYKLKGDKKKAIEYYEKTIKFGDEQAKIYAMQQIEELKE